MSDTMIRLIENKGAPQPLQKSIATADVAVVLLPLLGAAQVAVLRERLWRQNCRIIATQLSEPMGPELGWVRELVQEQWMVTTGNGINRESERSLTQKEPFWCHASCSDGSYGISKSGHLAEVTFYRPPCLLGEASKVELHERQQILCRAFGLYTE